MAYTKRGPFVNDNAPYINAANLNAIEDGIANAASTADAALAASSGASGIYGGAALDSFAGASDDAKLTAALSYAAAQTQIPAIMMPTTRVPTFSQGGRVPFSGMKIVGGPGGNRNPELSSGKFVSSFVKLRCGNAASSWFVGAGAVYNVYIADIGFEGSSNVQFWEQPMSTAPGLYSCRFENLGFNLFKHIIGRPGSTAAMTQVEFSGHWTANNAWDQQFTIGGSDNQLWMDGYINMGTGQSGSLSGDNTKFYAQFAGLSNTNVGYMYLSGLNGYNCLRITGNSDGLQFFGGVYEGYKPSGVPSGNGALTLANPGSVIRIEGGSGAFYGGNFGQAMAQPPADHLGVIDVKAGEWNFHSPNFYKGTMAESVPMISRSGTARVAVFGATKRTGESWTARPGFKANTGGSSDIYPASSMTSL